MKSPAYGPIRAKCVHQRVARLRADKWVRLGLELEVMLTVGKDVPASSTPWDKESIAPYVGSARAAFELIEDRGADYSKPNVFGLIGLVGWNGGSCVGPEVQGWSSLDIGNLDGEVFFNGRRIAGGTSRDVLGHPYNSLAFLANKLAEHGKRLRKGMIVSTGSMVACQFIPPETEAVGKIAGLGEVRVIYELPKAAARKSPAKAAVKPASRRAAAGAKKAGARRARRT
jgi:2-keto-4-pentenoate hydratase